MTKKNYLKIFKQSTKTLILFTILGLLLAIIFSVVQPLKYSSTSRLLITQQTGSADAYAASRSVERIAEELASIVYTSNFLEKVLSIDGFGIDKMSFPDDETKRRKAWGKMVDMTVARGSGMLTVKVYHVDPDQALKISQVISFLLTTEGWTYVSGGNIIVQEVDKPLVSQWPVKPNIPLNAASGMIIGIVVGIGYIVARNELV